MRLRTPEDEYEDEYEDVEPNPSITSSTKINKTKKEKGVVQKQRTNIPQEKTYEKINFGPTDEEIRTDRDYEKSSNF